MKRCSGCEKEKPLAEFGKNKNERDGLMRQCSECNRVRALKHYYNNKNQYSSRDKARRFRRHGITEELYLEEIERNDGCGICHRRFEIYVIDHDHTHCPGLFGCSECVRGVICGFCNKGLGNFKDSPESLLSAYNYINKVRAQVRD